MDDTTLLAGLAALAGLAVVVVSSQESSQDGGGGGGAGITPQRIPEDQVIRIKKIIKKEMKAPQPAPAPQPARVQRSRKKVHRSSSSGSKKRRRSHIWRDEETGHILVGTERRNTDITALKKHGWKVKGYDRNTGRVYLENKRGLTKFVDRSGRQYIKKGNKIMSVRTYLESKRKRKKKKKKEDD